MNKKILRDAGILFAITLIAGLLLGVVYAVTQQPIEAAQLEKQQEAYQTVFADAASFADMELDAEAAASGLQAAGYEKDTIDEVKQALDAEGNLLGYAMTVTSSEAYSGELQIAVGIRLDGTVNQISFLSISETMGLGMEAKEPDFYEQFSGVQTDAFVCTKSGAATENEIDALSGATITSRAVTNAVNAALCYADELGLEPTEQGGAENE